MNTDNVNEALERLKVVTPHLICALREAKESGQPVIFIAVQNEDDGGQMILSLEEPEDFVQDLTLVLGISPEPTEEQYAEYKAEQFLSKFGL